MSKAREKRIWAADLETTTETDWREEGEVRCYLWHARRLFSEEEASGTNIESLLDFLHHQADTVWFHNVKFDGSFILDAILRNGWKYGGVQERKQPRYDHIVTDTGQWMRLVLKFGDHVVKIQDSAKKFPGLSLEQIAKVYHIEGKSSLDVYTRRPTYHVPTLEEITRVKGDTRILKVAMEDLLLHDMVGLTMAGDAMRFYKDQYEKKWGRYAKRQYLRDYPKLPLELDKLIRDAYRGGWVYVNPRHRGRALLCITVIDKNSMYPSWMKAARLPYGNPIKRKQPGKDELYIIHFAAIFKLKPGHFPTVQLKGDFRYMQSEYIEESSTYLELCMTNLDYELFHMQYDVYDEINKEYLCFRSRVGDYDDYIDYWMAEKIRCDEAGDEAGRARCKRYLNSLYGKRGENPIKKSKVSYMGDDGVVKWDTVEEEMEGEYLPHAVWITAYARYDIVTNAQKFGEDFVYADTDSIHALNAEKYLGDMDIDDYRLGAWKPESWAMLAKYISPKKYLHLNEYKKGKITTQTVACAGMPAKCKEGVNFENFELGHEFEGKLMGRTVKGGYCLIETTFKIRLR